MILHLIQAGQTPLSIAERLGYISVVDTLKPITEVTETIPTSDDKYKVVSPETMQETFLSDSEDEGGRYFLSFLDMCFVRSWMVVEKICSNYGGLDNLDELFL